MNSEEAITSSYWIKLIKLIEKNSMNTDIYDLVMTDKVMITGGEFFLNVS